MPECPQGSYQPLIETGCPVQPGNGLSAGEKTQPQQLGVGVGVVVGEVVSALQGWTQ